MEEIGNLDDICLKCKMKTVRYTFHCAYCEKCIEGWDHHCYWINNCIGKKNIDLFFIFLIVLIINILINSYLNIFCIVNDFDENGKMIKRLEAKYLYSENVNSRKNVFYIDIPDNSQTMRDMFEFSKLNNEENLLLSILNNNYLTNFFEKSKLSTHQKEEKNYYFTSIFSKNNYDNNKNFTQGKAIMYKIIK